MSIFSIEYPFIKPLIKIENDLRIYDFRFFMQGYFLEQFLL